jgi:hypothetical protein
MRKLVLAALTLPLQFCYSEPDVTLVCDGSPCSDSDLAMPSDDGGSSASDAGTDLTQPQHGCAASAGATAISPTVSACAGTFALGSARTLCKTGWVVPTAATGIDLAACNLLIGWFSGDAPAYWVGVKSDERCGTGPRFQNLSYGCGSHGTVGIKQCGGFTRSIDGYMDGWQTENGELDRTANTNPLRGVLCAKP